MHTFLNFNTSYVTVQLLKKFFIKLYKKISIHLMLRFNYGWYSNIWIRRKFQYILCYGSTFIFFHKKIPPKIFQYILCYGSTTHSGFRLLQQNQFQYILCYGSTKTISILCKNKIRISIHLMLRFNGGRRK